MSIYTPDLWIVIKVTNKDKTHYRVFGSWLGGYLDGDSWIMNSGIVRVEETNEMFKFYGKSGSCYICYKNAYGISNYSSGILDSIAEQSVIFKVSKMDKNTDWNSINY